jgi:glutaredoxin 3
MQITVYSTTTCPYCQMLKTYLKEKNIAFTEKMVDTDEVARDEMTTVSGGFLGVPFTLIVKDDSTRETVVGFDKGKLETLLQVPAQNPVQQV